jgi:hypothetical protein
MNIFILDTNPVLAAQYQCDKHVVKMCLETAQMLSTIAGGPYKPTHVNHPCTVWARSSVSNFAWLYAHGVALCNEYEHRYNKVHKCLNVIENTLVNMSVTLPDEVLSPFAQAMPEELKNEDAVKAYRDYYHQKSKTVDMRWTKRPIPDWFVLRNTV